MTLLRNLSRTLRLLPALAVLLLGLSGCGSQQLAQYAGAQPSLDLRQYFDGTLDAYGVFTDRSGSVVKRFTVVMVCHWEDDQGTLDEEFTYSDGSHQKRIWRLTRLADGHYRGRADDVEGEAQGQTSGNAFQWGYTLLLPWEGRTLAVSMDDWMYLMNDRVMLNKARMSKFGIHLGDVTLSFYKR